VPTTKYDICRIARESTQRYRSPQLDALEQQPITWRLGAGVCHQRGFLIAKTCDFKVTVEFSNAYTKVIWLWQLPIAPTLGDHRRFSRRGQLVSWLASAFAGRRRIHAASRAEHPTH
jgi:hypothetical protein